LCSSSTVLSRLHYLFQIITNWSMSLNKRETSTFVLPLRTNRLLQYFQHTISQAPKAEVTQSKIWNVFGLSNTEIVGSNPTRGRDVCPNFFRVCFVLYRQWLLDRTDDPSKQCYWLFIKKIPWSESASELYRPSDRRLSVKWLPTFADRGCHMDSVTDPYDRILGFLDRSRHYFSFLVVPGIEPWPPDL
jgi:hypothetical protein